MREREWPADRAREWLLRTAANFVKDGNLDEEAKALSYAAWGENAPRAIGDELAFRGLLSAVLWWQQPELDRAVAWVYGDAPEVPPKTGETGGIWRKRGIAGGKYLIQRRDGTVPEWPSFVLGAKDPAAPAALRAYAGAADEHRFDAAFVADVRGLADEFEAYRLEHGNGDPDGVPHRKDDPEVVAKMLRGGNA